MPSNESILEQLRNNNPFASSNSPMPFENTNPDIAQLNRDASEEIEQLIRQKRREPNLPLTGLIFGAAGIGKTHMMTRILRKLRKHSWPAIFVTVRAFTNPKRVMHELLSEVLICLNKPHSGGRSQFDVMTEGMMTSYRENRKNDGFSNIDEIDRKSYLRRDMPDINRNFLKCLLLYIDSVNETEKYEITEWLRDGLDDEDSERLGLPLRDTNQMDDAECERSAKSIMASIGIVLSYAHIPMIICFDELDSIRDSVLMEAWGDVLGFLVNHIDGILPLCFVKSETWETFKPVINLSILQRLRSNTIIMNGTCSPAIARQIIHDRIAHNFSDGAEQIYQWLISRMNNVLTPGLSPRMVIDLANQALKTDSDPEKIIQEIYDDEHKKVQAAPQVWPPNAEHLTLALEVWLSSLEGFTVQKDSGKYIRLQGIHGNTKFAFIVITAKAHATVSAALKAGMSFMAEYPGSECFYISEDKTHKKTWKQANENLRKFIGQGGHSLILDKDTRINWYALTALINRVDNGDVNIYSASQTRTATRRDILGFVRTLKLIDSPSLKFSPVAIIHTPTPTKFGSKSKPQPTVYYDDKLFSDTLSSIITSSPMKILAVDKAVDLLSQRGIKVGRNEIISFVKKNFERFRSYSTKNDTLITLAEKK